MEVVETAGFYSEIDNYSFGNLETELFIVSEEDFSVIEEVRKFLIWYEFHSINGLFVLKPLPNDVGLTLKNYQCKKLAAQDYIPNFSKLVLGLEEKIFPIDFITVCMQKNVH